MRRCGWTPVPSLNQNGQFGRHDQTNVWTRCEGTNYRWCAVGLTLTVKDVTLPKIKTTVKKQLRMMTMTVLGRVIYIVMDQGKENVKEIVEMIVKYFPQTEPFKDPFGLFGTQGVGEGAVVDGFNTAVAKPFPMGSVKGLIHTKVGDGPRVLGEEEALLGSNGLPNTVS